MEENYAQVTIQFKEADALVLNLLTDEVSTYLTDKSFQLKFRILPTYVDIAEYMVDKKIECWASVVINQSHGELEIYNRSLRATAKSLDFINGKFWLTLRESNVNL